MSKFPDLHYALEALEPLISCRTLHVHHDKHHDRCIKTLNDLLEGAKPPPLSRHRRHSGPGRYDAPAGLRPLGTRLSRNHADADLRGLSSRTWIPAFAGMTGVGVRVVRFQQTPVTPAEAGVQFVGL